MPVMQGARQRFAAPALLRRRCSSNSPHNPFDFNLAFVLAGLREVVGHLQPQPSFRATAECLVETDCLRRYSALTVHEIVEGLPRHTQNVCGLGDGQIKGFDAVIPDGKPWMWRVFHRRDLSLLLS